VKNIVQGQTIWTVKVSPQGVVWREAQVVRLTETRATILLDGIKAVVGRERLDYGFLAYSRRHRCRFAAGRHGLAEAIVEIEWALLYGRRAAAQDKAAALLGLPPGQEHYEREEVQAAFRKTAKGAHPDRGGDPEVFDAVVKARDALCQWQAPKGGR